MLLFSTSRVLELVAISKVTNEDTCSYIHFNFFSTKLFSSTIEAEVQAMFYTGLDIVFCILFQDLKCLLCIM